MNFLSSVFVGCLSVLFFSNAHAQSLVGNLDDFGTLTHIQEDVSAVSVHDHAPLEKDVVRAKSLLGHNLENHHLWVLVDRNPAIQRLWLLAHFEDHNYVVAEVPVSTGKPGRKEHFKTPVGVFLYNGDILGYRALGTFNENGIRGIGLKGERVWDFGWQRTEDWRHKGSPMDIRMAMHATDPANLAHRLGHWDSEGCIRLPQPVEKAFDHWGIFDEQTSALAKEGDRGWSSLLKNTHFNSWMGDTLVVVDSSEPS